MDSILYAFLFLLSLATIFLHMFDAVPWISWEQYVPCIIISCLLPYMLNSMTKRDFISIRREGKLLSAVRDDVSKFQASKDRHVSGPGHNQKLQELWLQRADEWVKTREEMIEKLQCFTSAFEAREGNFFCRYFQFLQIKQVYSICWNLPKKEDFEDVKGFYVPQDKSGSRFRSLQEQEISVESASARTEPQAVGPVRKLVSSVLQKARKESQNMQELELKMILLEGFLKDLEDVELESAIEKAWIDEVKALMDDLHRAIETFDQRKKRRFRFDCLLAKPLFSREMKTWASGLAGLLEATKNYGFQFSRSQAQSHPYPKDLEDLLKDIKSLKTKIKSLKIRELDDLLEDMSILLEGMKAIEFEGASKFKSACLAQLNKIKDEAEKNFDEYIKAQKDSAPYRASLKTIPIKNAIKDIKGSVNAYNKVRRKSSSTSIIGLEEDTKKVVEWLLNEGRGSVYSIVGMQGIGKTTLAKKVFHHGDISNKFPLRIWVPVPKGSNDAVALLEGVSTQLKRNNEPPDDWVQNIRNLLKDKKYLVVLDNISTTTVWKTLKEAFRPSPERCNGRILLTTRDKTVASDCQILELQLRSKEESWELFKEKMHLSPLSRKVLSEVATQRGAEEKVARCEGLPNTISCLASLMSRSNLNGQESLMSGEVGELMDKHEKRWSKHWENIQGSLRGQQHLRNLVTYFTIFPPGFEIPVRRLIALWVAEELVQKRDVKEVEQTAEEYLGELIRLDLIQPVKKNGNGKLKACRLPIGLYQRLADYGSNPHRKQGVGYDTYTIKLRVRSNRRLADCGSNTHRKEDVGYDTYTTKLHVRSNQRPADHDDNFRHIRDADTLLSDKELVTFISFDTRDGHEPAKDIEHVLWRRLNGKKRFRKLKVLDLERVFGPHLPESIGDLTELRYLGLRWTYLEEIPKTIGKLQRLQTLDLKHTYIRTLPSTIWSLEHLRHLYLNHAYWGKFVRQTKGKYLQNLQILWGLFVHEENPLKDSLEDLKGLRKLELAFQLKTDKQKKLLEKVASLKNLHTLRLSSIWRTSSTDVSGITQDLCLVDLSALQYLSNLYLFGKLNDTVNKLGCLPVQCLSDLTLSASELQVDPMQLLKRLTNLRSLCLMSNSFTGESMGSSAESFPRLVVLKLWKLGGLKAWNIQENAMKSLKELEIRSCQKLEVPNGLKHLKSLRELKLRYMPEEFTKRLILNEEPPVWDSISNMPAIITYS